MPGLNPADPLISISRYLNVRAAYFPSFTPDGRRIAFITDITGVPQVWQVALSTGPGDEIVWPEQVSFGPERVLGVWCSPVPGDDRLIYARDAGGDENAQLILLMADGTERRLTPGFDHAMHVFGEWSADGRRFLFAANRRNPGLFDLYLQPLEGEARMVWQNDEPGFLRNILFAPGGRRAAATRMSSSFRHALLEIDLDSGTSRLLSPPNVFARFTGLCYAADGRSLYVNTDLDSDFLHIARLDLNTLAVEPVAALAHDIEYMTGSADGRFLAYAVNVDGASELAVLDTAGGAVRAAPRLEASPGVIGMEDQRLTWSPDSARVAFSFTSATRTSDIYVWDLGAGRVRAATRSSHGGLPLDSFVAPQLIQYPTFDRDEAGARHIPAWFYLPRDRTEGATPAVVVVHGGPESQFRPSFQFFIQYFLAHGFAVLAPNVRGSTGYGKAYSHLDDVRRRMDSVADLAHAAYWLKDQADVDGDRLAVYGGSYGGFMVLSAMTTYPDLWAAGVELKGISNFVTFLENTSAYRRAHREAEYGSLREDRAFLQSISPLNYVEQIAAPLMVIHGANDPRVPLSEARQLVEALRARGVPAEFLVFDDEGHGIVRLKNKLVAYSAIVEFLGKHLSHVA